MSDTFEITLRAFEEAVAAHRKANEEMMAEADRLFRASEKDPGIYRAAEADPGSAFSKLRSAADAAYERLRSAYTALVEAMPSAGTA